MDKDYSAPNFRGEVLGGNDDNISCMIDYMFNRNLQQQKQPMPRQQPHQLAPSRFGATPSFDKMSFADAMQFADFGLKPALNQTTNQEYQETGIDPVYFLKFPVMNEKIEDYNQTQHSMSFHKTFQEGDECGGNIGNSFLEDNDNNPVYFLSQTRNQDYQETGIDPVYVLKFPVMNEKIEDYNQTQHSMSFHKTFQEGGVCGENIGNVFLEEHDNTSMQLRYIQGAEEEDRENKNVTTKEVKSKRKRARISKTIEEVERQRMAHIAVERNRRKKMNEHLSVLRSLMPGSYVQRGDQASIIGGVIEFVGELEQLLQCLESQKRRRISRETGDRQMVDMTTPTNSSSSPTNVVANQTQPLIITENAFEIEGGGGGGWNREETVENKSCLADVEVKLLGFDAIIKILSRRRPGQLTMTIAALEDLDLSILHTNITTMEQAVLYTFNVKITSGTRFTAEDIASTIQQVFSFIYENTTM